METVCMENAMPRLTGAPVLIALSLGVASAALAQSTSSGPNKAPDQNAPSHFDSQAGNERDQNLSQRLDRSDGVIHPPGHVDPEMRIAPPATGDKMPVVPPPGAPGGDQSVKPKITRRNRRARNSPPWRKPSGSMPWPSPADRCHSTGMSSLASPCAA